MLGGVLRARSGAAPLGVLASAGETCVRRDTVGHENSALFRCTQSTVRGALRVLAALSSGVVALVGHGWLLGGQADGTEGMMHRGGRCSRSQSRLG